MRGTLGAWDPTFSAAIRLLGNQNSAEGWRCGYVGEELFGVLFGSSPTKAPRRIRSCSTGLTAIGLWQQGEHDTAVDSEQLGTVNFDRLILGQRSTEGTFQLRDLDRQRIAAKRCCFALGRRMILIRPRSIRTTRSVTRGLANKAGLVLISNGQSAFEKVAAACRGR